MGWRWPRWARAQPAPHCRRSTPSMTSTRPPSSRSDFRQTGGRAGGRRDPISHTRSAVCRLATLHSAPSSAGHRADDLGPGSARSVEKMGRQRPRATATAGGVCKGPRGPGRELGVASQCQGSSSPTPLSTKERLRSRANREQAWDSGQPAAGRRSLGKGGAPWGQAQAGPPHPASPASLPSWTSCCGAPSHQASCSGDRWLSPRSRGAESQLCPAEHPRLTPPWRTFSPSRPLSVPSSGPRTTSVPSI